MNFIHTAVPTFSHISGGTRCHYHHCILFLNDQHAFDNVHGFSLFNWVVYS